jgi:hypothetical protein
MIIGVLNHLKIAELVFQYESTAFTCEKMRSLNSEPISLSLGKDPP